MRQAVAQLVEALRYKPEGRGFDSQLSLEFFIDIILPGRSMALRSAQSLTETSTSNISLGVKAAVFG
jgi:hypothetical protein